jgi:hypothetical protein
MNPWKAATIGIALVTVTAFTTGLTTAYVMRPARDVEAQAVVTAPDLTAPTVVARPAVRYATARRYVSAPVTGASVAVPAAPPPVITPNPPAQSPGPGPVRPVAAECATTGDRVWRTAKPGLLGALLGAGLGAAGGAVADGGKGAGKGAVIGGLAGVAAGGIYGAYKTKQECGTVLGEHAFTSEPTRAALDGAPGSTQTAFQPGITIDNAR